MSPAKTAAASATTQGDLHPPIVTTYGMDSIVYRVVEQFNNRARIGLEKYGTTLDRGDLSTTDWIQHAQEELMDAILYLEKLKHTISYTCSVPPL